jgi:hypothetical protein
VASFYTCQYKNLTGIKNRTESWTRAPEERTGESKQLQKNKQNKLQITRK